MSDIRGLLEECHLHRAKLVAIDNRLKVQASNPLPDTLVAELKNHKTEIQQYLIQAKNNKTDNWLEEEWVRINIPCWRRILRESIEGNDKRRELYARRMLREVLEDPDYKENQP